MAFKRSAVRSRLSPPSQRECEEKPHFFGSGVFALCGDGNDVHAHAELLRVRNQRGQQVLAGTAVPTEGFTTSAFSIARSADDRCSP